VFTLPHGRGSECGIFGFEVLLPSPAGPAKVLKFAAMRLLIAVTLSLALVRAASLPTATPEQAGLSSERLKRINVVMREHIDTGRLAAASGLIARNGKVVFR